MQLKEPTLVQCKIDLSLSSHQKTEDFPYDMIKSSQVREEYGGVEKKTNAKMQDEIVH